MAPRTKTEQTLTLPVGSQVNPQAKPEKSERQKLRERTLANYMYYILTAKTQPEMTNACVKLAAEYDTSNGEFIFSIEEISKIVYEAKNEPIVVLENLQRSRELTIDLAANL